MQVIIYVDLYMASIKINSKENLQIVQGYIWNANCIAHNNTLLCASRGIVYLGMQKQQKNKYDAVTVYVNPSLDHSNGWMERKCVRRYWRLDFREGNRNYIWYSRMLSILILIQNEDSDFICSKFPAYWSSFSLFVNGKKKNLLIRQESQRLQPMRTERSIFLFLFLLTLISMQQIAHCFTLSWLVDY